MISRTVPLSEWDGEVKAWRWGQVDGTALTFTCPICSPEREHWHVVPFEPGKSAHSTHDVIGHVWGHIAGETADDLTLQPSYLAISGRCRLHLYVRNGHLQILSDSGVSDG